ncbi:hypothetical protein E4U53_002220 [Claviceps sorghi]|nr:hypothetical protein E4U53_002220 [Claviceps sorghi]
MRFLAAAWAAATWLGGAGVGAGASSASAPPPSIHMLDSIVARRQGIVDSGAVTNTLEAGILAQAVQAVLARHPDKRDTLAPFLTQVLNLASSQGLTNSTFASLRPLDRFALATAIDSAVASGVSAVTLLSIRASAAIHDSLALQRRSPNGGFFYFVYPFWSYLDGIFSLLPYLAAQPTVDYHEMQLQVALLVEHCAQANTSLLVHGYDWSRTAVWADKETGGSPYVWGRSLGWFLAGLVQAWERLPCASAREPPAAAAAVCRLLRDVFTRVSADLLRYRDPASGAWWQLVTLPGQPGNYLESSSTALFVFSLLKAQRTGLLRRGDAAAPDYQAAALKAYDYALASFVTTNPADGTIGYNDTVAVCSLNSTASYEYYTKRPLLPNSLLGESAFILASLEVERLHHKELE